MFKNFAKIRDKKSKLSGVTNPINTINHHNSVIYYYILGQYTYISMVSCTLDLSGKNQIFYESALKIFRILK